MCGNPSASSRTLRATLLLPLQPHEQVAEETGILLPSARLVAVENVLFNGGAGPHYLVLFMLGRAPPGAEPRVLEPTKCAAWTWVGLDELGSAPYAPLFQPLQQLLDRGWRPNQANAEL